ncbi:hypothetical protein NL64_09195 [Pseudomonas fluorescens]|nr:hypothetical protein NL64_09195 [Pseudomonas fluorescens]
MIPFELIKHFRGDVFCKPLGKIKHIYWYQAFFNFRTWTPKCGDVDWVDAIDAVTNKGAFTPTNDLFADAYGAWLSCNDVIMVYKCVQNLSARRFGCFLPVIVVDV